MRGQRLEVGGQKLEVGSWKSEISESKSDEVFCTVNNSVHNPRIKGVTTRSHCHE